MSIASLWLVPVPPVLFQRYSDRAIHGEQCDCNAQCKHFVAVLGMQKPFTTQPELFVTTRDLDHPTLHALDDTEAVLD